MSLCKLRAIVESIRRQSATVGDSPEDGCDVDEVITCFGLDKLLSGEEQGEVREELLAVAEADACMERLRLIVQR